MFYVFGEKINWFNFVLLSFIKTFQPTKHLSACINTRLIKQEVPRTLVQFVFDDEIPCVSSTKASDKQLYRVRASRL